ncbi:hypothetical protein OOK27_22835 [Streptomyces canus]|uniref:hypothetical protein n=1 Tax=Streptomyces canus TaxID=58343 RepID=UPI00224F0F3C|nr:hypothetical protein [Streptomyces canus]MCX5256925.1 hypothetical protein [Streptomyces canus]
MTAVVRTPLHLVVRRPPVPVQLYLDDTADRRTHSQTAESAHRSTPVALRQPHAHLRRQQEDFADGVKVFYDVGKLACIALDAVTGPQVLLAGFALAGRDPEQAHQFLLDYAAEHGSCLLYT